MRFTAAEDANKAALTAMKAKVRARARARVCVCVCARARVCARAGVHEACA
jgi:hypothetical protein